MSEIKKKVVITADSTCDLTQEQREKYGIDVFPLPVNLGDEQKLDGFNIVPQDLFNYYKETGKLPTTSAPSIVECSDFYKPYAQKGLSVVHFSISSAATITHQNHMAAAAEYEDIYPVDSLTMSSGMGRLAIEAVKLAELGLSGAEIKEKINQMRPLMEVSFILDTLEYMWKGGRCSGVAALGANMLKLKPCIEVKDGKMQVCKKYRGSMDKVREDFMVDRLANAKDVDLSACYITHCNVDEKILKSAIKRIKELQPFQEVIPTNVGCSVANHCGPGTFGLIYMRTK